MFAAGLRARLNRLESNDGILRWGGGGRYERKLRFAAHFFDSYIRRRSGRRAFSIFVVLAQEIYDSLQGMNGFCLQ